MAIATGDRAPEFDLEEAVDSAARAALRLPRPLERPARLPPLRVHAGVHRGGAGPPGEPRLLPQREHRDRVRLVRHVRRAPGLEGRARRGVHVRVGLLVARGRGQGLRRLQRGDGRPAPRHVPDRPRRRRHLVARGRPGQAPDGDGARLARARSATAREPRRRRHEAGTKPARTRHRFRGYRDSRGAAPPWGAVDQRPAAPAGDADAARPRLGRRGSAAVVCLHGVTAWGGHFERLATALAATHRVVAPDLLGHGASPWEPPWRIADHLDAIEATLGDEPATWIGHSFGARLALEQAARRPGSVERLVLLDPAIVVPPHVALWAAENARAERRYASFDDAVERRFDESQLHDAPRALVEDELRGHLVEDDAGWRYRYAQAAVVAAHGGARGARPRLRRDPRADPRRPRRRLVPPVRPARRGAPGRARRPARGRDGAGRAHRALGRARRDDGGRPPPSSAG